MKIYLPNLAPDESPVRAWRKTASRLGHNTVDRFQDADLCLFVEAHLLGGHPLMPEISAHPAWSLAPGRCAVYDERDLPLGHLPGAYVSLPVRRHGPGRIACAYYSGGVLPSDATGSEPPWLYSFIGSRSHSVRDPVLDLTDPRAVIEDTTGFVFFDPTQHDFVERQARFDRVMWDSKFIVCPRGRGTSSIRSYETLQRGRVPVIIADDWVAPDGPDWDAISIRVAESDVEKLPRILRDAEPRFEKMSLAASAAYDEFFRPHRVVESLLDVLPQVAMEGTPSVPRRDVLRSLRDYRVQRVRSGLGGARRAVRGLRS